MINKKLILPKFDNNLLIFSRKINKLFFTIIKDKQAQIIKYCNENFVHKVKIVIYLKI